MFCQKCGSDLMDGTKVCTNCGALQGNAKFCQHCGEAIDADCVVCPKCGKQVQELRQEQQPQVIINNTNTNTSNSSSTATVNGGVMGRPKNKWVALCLCIFLGFLGGHKFYEGKVGMGILYLFTGGLFAIGVIIDLIAIATKPNPYYT